MLDIPLSPALVTGAPGNPSVVLLDRHGRPSGTAPKATVHGPATPLHLAFSCYVVDGHGRILITRRSSAKRTWPSTWTNACCGHPLPGETLREAVNRHLHDELGAGAARLALALPDFTYRATMFDGTVEHELCPVVVATLDGRPTLSPVEADDAVWVEWDVLVARARHAPSTLSPWSVRQIAALHETIGHPASWLACHAGGSDDPRPAGRRAVGTPALDPFGPTLQERLDEVIECRTERLSSLDERSAVLGTVLHDLVGRAGKRLRPAFVHWGHVAAGGSGEEPRLLELAVAVELLHTFALVHDDVIDRSGSRRGGPSVHAGLAAIAGDGDSAAWFGVSAAIVAGDLAFVWADELLDAACAGSPNSTAVRSAFTTLRTEVIAGQFLDVSASLGADSAVAADPLRIALLKSGRYTVTRPLELGACLAGAGRELVAVLERFGDAAGVAFQLRDDVLGVFGDERLTGKDATSDLREGKRTLLVARAMELSSRAAGAELRGLLGHSELDDDGAARCREIIADCGALASVEARIAAEAHVAAVALAAVPSPAADALATLLEQLVERTA